MLTKMSTTSDLQMAELSCAVHGVLAALHLLGIAYNLKRGNRFDVLAHSLAVGYDTWALHKHLKDVRAFTSSGMCVKACNEHYNAR